MKLLIRVLIIAVVSVCISRIVYVAGRNEEKPFTAVESDFGSEILKHFERDYILIVPEGNKAAFCREGDISPSGMMGHDTSLLGVNDDFMPYGMDDHVNTTATLRAIHKDAAELHVKVDTDFVSMGGGIRAETGMVTVPFSPSWKAAIYKGDAGALRVLLDKGLDVNSRDGYGRTLLMVAGFYGNSEMIKMLLDRNADISRKQKDGYTALTLSLQHADIVRLLLDKGAVIEKEDLFKAMRCELGTMKLLIERGADIHVKDEDGNTLLPWAFDENTDIVQFLLDKGAVIGPGDLIAAADQCKIKTMELFIKHGADIHMRDSQGRSLLTYARRPEMSELLKSHGLK